VRRQEYDGAFGARPRQATSGLARPDGSQVEGFVRAPIAARPLRGARTLAERRAPRDAGHRA